MQGTGWWTKRLAMAVLVAGLGLASCSSGDGSDGAGRSGGSTTTSTVADDGKAEDVPAVKEHPTFTEGDCWWPRPENAPTDLTITCGTVEVPSDRSDPDTPMLHLAAVRLHRASADASAPPLVYLHGGPGGSALVGGLGGLPALDVLADHDLIAYDQRGTGLSTPSLNCPEKEEAILDALVEGYGRQRPPERAAVHYQIARIAKARGELGDALAQLELASTIDMAHTGIFRLLGQLAREAGQLDRAERAFRALLMLVRRQTGAAAQAPDAIGPSEVLFELHDIAERLGQAQRARETLESAFETASRSDLEARRFERALRAAGQADLLLRVIDMRLTSETAPERVTELKADRARALAQVGLATGVLHHREPVVDESAEDRQVSQLESLMVAQNCHEIPV